MIRYALAPTPHSDADGTEFLLFDKRGIGNPIGAIIRFPTEAADAHGAEAIGFQAAAMAASADLYCALVKVRHYLAPTGLGPVGMWAEVAAALAKAETVS